MSTGFNFNYDEYVELLQAVASLSRLYSDNNKAYIDPNFVERLFVHTSNAIDLSKKYNSFDAYIPESSIGIGIKTFGVTSKDSTKKEKVAELTRFAGKGMFNGLDQEQIAKKASGIRNDRIITDIAEYSLDIDKSYYHCLLRINGGAIIHQEPYCTIDIDNIRPVHPTKFTNISKFPSGVGSPVFSDGKNIYSYSISKNVLYKRFEIRKGTNSDFIPLHIHEDIFQKILLWFAGSRSQTKSGIKLPRKSITNLIAPQKPSGVPGVNFVVLPLYGTRNKKIKTVEPKSGINQWNAGGRKRKFGETYIPVPSAIRNTDPNFFPNKDVVFELVLPDGLTVNASICQENGKALMSNPNDLLCDWLFRVINPNYSEKERQRRFDNKIPFTYEDLERVGKDSVKVNKLSKDRYSIEFMPLDSYSNFIENKELDEGDVEV